MTDCVVEASTCSLNPSSLPKLNIGEGLLQVLYFGPVWPRRWTILWKHCPNLLQNHQHGASLEQQSEIQLLTQQWLYNNLFLPKCSSQESKHKNYITVIPGNLENCVHVQCCALSGEIKDDISKWLVTSWTYVK